MDIHFVYSRSLSLSSLPLPHTPSLSFVEAAGEKCYRCCSKAIELSPSNPEAHQLLASCLLSQGKEEDAKTSLMRGISLWLPSKVGGASSSSDGGASVATPPLSASSPPYFSRMSAAKLLIEVKEYDVSRFCVLAIYFWCLFDPLPHLRLHLRFLKVYSMKTMRWWGCGT